jgi:hypothetical protein
MSEVTMIGGVGGSSRGMAHSAIADGRARRHAAIHPRLQL